jgi:hypothetical protein
VRLGSRKKAEVVQLQAAVLVEMWGLGFLLGVSGNSNVQ